MRAQERGKWVGSNVNEIRFLPRRIFTFKLKQPTRFVIIIIQREEAIALPEQDEEVGRHDKTMTLRRLQLLLLLASSRLRWYLYPFEWVSSWATTTTQTTTITMEMKSNQSCQLASEKDGFSALNDDDDDNNDAKLEAPRVPCQVRGTATTAWELEKQIGHK